MRVLISYGSRYGSTEEIANKISGHLKDLNIESTVIDVKKERKWPTLEEYDGIIVGSGIKISKWMNEPRKFLEKNSQELKNKKLAVYILYFNIK